jgi:hypothetical protein
VEIEVVEIVPKHSTSIKPLAQKKRFFRSRLTPAK